MAAFLLLNGHAIAGIIFSTDGTASPTYVGPNWDAINGDTSFAIAMRFSAVDSLTVDSLTVAGFYSSGTPFAETFELFDDHDGIRGSTALDRFFITSTTRNIPALLTATSSTHIGLTEGHSYWLVALAPVGDGDIFRWNYSNTSGVGCEVPVAGNMPRAGNNQCALEPQITMATFALIGTSSAPEPNTCTLVLLPVLVLLLGLAYAARERPCACERSKR